MLDIKMKYGIDVGHKSMVVSTIGPDFAYLHQHFVYIQKLKTYRKYSLKSHSLAIFLAHPVDYSINAHSILADIELSYIKKQVAAAARVFPWKAHQQHFPERWPK